MDKRKGTGYWTRVLKQKEEELRIARLKYDEADSLLFAAEDIEEFYGLESQAKYFKKRKATIAMEIIDIERTMSRCKRLAARVRINHNKDWR